MCLLAGFGLMLIFGGVHVFTVTHGDDWLIAGITITTGLWFLSIIVDELRPSRIDVSVKNKVVAHDGHGRYLVQAATSHNIIGPRPHITGNLPAALYQQKKGLWILDSTGGPEPDASRIRWQSVKGSWHIEPRGNTVSGSFLRDIVEGWEHYYIVRDEE